MHAYLLCSKILPPKVSMFIIKVVNFRQTKKSI